MIEFEVRGASNFVFDLFLRHLISGQLGEFVDLGFGKFAARNLGHNVVGHSDVLTMRARTLQQQARGDIFLCSGRMGESENGPLLESAET